MNCLVAYEASKAIKFSQRSNLSHILMANSCCHCRQYEHGEYRESYKQLAKLTLLSEKPTVPKATRIADERKRGIEEERKSLRNGKL